MKRLRDIRCIRGSRFFDSDWYRRSYAEGLALEDPATHYLIKGAATGLDPGPCFSTRGYLRTNPDVAAAGLNPLVHFERYGRTEGRHGYAPSARAAPKLVAPRSDMGSRADYAVIVHAYHLDCFEDLAQALTAFPSNVDRYVSYPRDSVAHSEAIMRAAFPDAIPVAIDNVGQDIGAFLQVLERLDRSQYAFYCKLHSKQGDKLPALWREALLTGTVGNAARVAQFEQAFRDNPAVVLGGTQELFLHGPTYVMENEAHLTRLLTGADLPTNMLHEDWGFFAGSFFWMRGQLAEKMLACMPPADFFNDAVIGVPAACPAGTVPRDGQLALAGERLVGVLALAMGGQVALASCVDPTAEVTLIMEPSAGALRELIPMMQRLHALQSGWIGRRTKRMIAGQEPGLGFSKAQITTTKIQGDYAIITPTGDRAVAFNRCVQMVANQTVQPKEWIVVDDGVTPLADQLCLPEWATYIRRPPAPDDPPHTLSCNVLVALEHVKADRVLIFEDDDWYSPLYAEYMLPWFDAYDLIGLNLIRYYHLPGSAWKNGHPSAHTAFAQSGFCRGHAWDHLAAICRSGFAEIREKGIVDRHWWQTFEGKKFLINEHPCLHLGLKGGFGRLGLASGHERREVDYIPDPDGEYLQQVIGSDRVHYDRWRKRFKKPLMIYTVALGKEAAQKLPPIRRPMFDFYAFTDVPETLPQPWQAIPLEVLNGDMVAAISNVQMRPHLYFPDYEWSIWGVPDVLMQEDLESLIVRVIEAETDTERTMFANENRYRFVSLGGRATGAALKTGGVVLRCHPAPEDAHKMVTLWKALTPGNPPILNEVWP